MEAAEVVEQKFRRQTGWSSEEWDREYERVSKFTREDYMRIGEQARQEVGLEMEPGELEKLMAFLTTDLPFKDDSWQPQVDIEGVVYDCMLYMKPRVEEGYKIGDMVERAIKIYQKTGVYDVAIFAFLTWYIDEPDDVIVQKIKEWD